MEPTDLASHPYEKKKDLWEKRHSDYVALGNAEIAEEVLMGVFQAHIAPEEIRDHLFLHAARLTTYELLLAEVESWDMAKQGSASTPMDVGALMKGKGKGKKDDKKATPGGGWWQGYADAGTGKKPQPWWNTEKTKNAKFFAGYWTY